MNLISVRELYRPKASGLVAHNGLELIFENHSRKVFHNSPGTGPTICSYEEFAEGLPVTAKRKSTCNLLSVRKRIETLLGQQRKYHATDFNCEQTVSYVLSGIARSPQVKASVGTGLLFGGLCLLFGGSAKQALLATGVGSVTGLTISKSDLLRG